ncbi:transposase [Caballeronia temeraria]|uniref:Transposase n=1 Tax=Caballeronia temeraria TaxID=1777137 RepID=A0A158DWY7_9BURK|nr:IS110 family transposase [Caballeronia temeraria]SAK99078.1 transposase [Caballeronia temeraria]
MGIATIGVDLAKRVFAVHGVDRQGNTVLKRTLRRDQMVPFFTKLSSCTVAMEACGSAHYWARKLQSLHHQVKLIAPQFVKPYVKGNKHDAADAAAICEAASRPSMRFVSVKSEVSQAVLALHRVRSGFVKARTAQANQLRGLLAEFGFTAPLGVKALIDEVKCAMADEGNGLPPLMRTLTQRLLSHLLVLDRQVQEIDLQLRTIAKDSEVCRRLEEVPGIGPITSTALIASVGDCIHQFKNGRQLAAFLGLVPKQCSSGGKERLQGISKRGDVYLRQLLVHGARAVLGHTLRKPERAGSWLSRLAARRNTNIAAIAQANKMARVVWAMLTRKEGFRSDTATVLASNIGPA